MKGSYDAVIVGGGHNGLVAAAYLARAGFHVLLAERREVLGGAAATEEVFPGFQVNTGSSEAGLFLPEIVADLNLANHGLQFLRSPSLAFAPQPDDRSLTLWRDPARSQKEIACFSKDDAEHYPFFLRQVRKLARVLAAASTRTPPSVPKLKFGELLPWLRVARDWQNLGRRDAAEFLRVLPMPVADYLDEWFESPALKGILGSVGVMGGLLGPRASGTTFMFLYQATRAEQGAYRSSAFVRGGAGALSAALASAARQHGAEICTGLAVADLTIEGSQATGVVFENGERVAARAILSNATPRHTFFDLIGPAHLELRFVREVNNIRFRGGTARLNLALTGLPRFTGLSMGEEYSLHLSGHTLICPGLDYLERAADEAKYGSFSRQPYLDITFPTILDPALAPPGQHLGCIDVQYAPYYLQEGDWDQLKERLGDQVLAILEAYAPGLRSLIIDQQVLTPLDLERRFGLTEGCIYHGQMALDQLLFMRPVAGYGRYRTPLGQLYLCGSGVHPGGGLTGVPGYNAAREVIYDLRRARGD